MTQPADFSACSYWTQQPLPLLELFSEGQHAVGAVKGPKWLQAWLFPPKAQVSVRPFKRHDTFHLHKTKEIMLLNASNHQLVSRVAVRLLCQNKLQQDIIGSWVSYCSSFKTEHNFDCYFSFKMYKLSHQHYWISVSLYTAMQIHAFGCCWHQPANSTISNRCQN